MTQMWLGYPEPGDTDSLPRISIQEVASMIRNDPAGQDFQLIDVRRSDLTGSMIMNSLNLPAHTFYPSRQRIASLLGNKKILIFYCGSSNGRGPRCAGWLRDAFDLDALASKPEIKIMAGGAKAFMKEYGTDVDVVTKLPDGVKET